MVLFSIVGGSFHVRSVIVEMMSHIRITASTLSLSGTRLAATAHLVCGSSFFDASIPASAATTFAIGMEAAALVVSGTGSVHCDSVDFDHLFLSNFRTYVNSHGIATGSNKFPICACASHTYDEAACDGIKSPSIGIRGKVEGGCLCAAFIKSAGCIVEFITASFVLFLVLVLVLLVLVFFFLQTTAGLLVSEGGLLVGGRNDSDGDGGEEEEVLDEHGVGIRLAWVVGIEKGSESLLGLSSKSFLCGSDNDAVVPPMFFGGQLLLIAVHRRNSTLKNLNWSCFCRNLSRLGSVWLGRRAQESSKRVASY